MNLTTMRTLPVKLTDDEVNTYARQVAEKLKAARAKTTRAAA